MEKNQIEALIAGRPRVYGWLGFQKFLLWTFLILGLILLINTFIIISVGLVKYYFIYEASEEIAENYKLKQADVQVILVRYLHPIRCKAILYSFFLSCSLFIIARYCQKIINRNRYILLLEQEWQKTQFKS